MVCAQVIGNDAAVTVAGASGSFELNVADAGHRPQRARVGPAARRLLPAARRALRRRHHRRRRAGCAQYAESSPSVVTPLNKYIGYEAAAKVAKQALADGATIRETVIGLGLRRARRAHRGAAGRGARRGVDDPPVSNDADEVRRQYATEANLETRRAVWSPGPSGTDPLDLVVEAVRSALTRTPGHARRPGGRLRDRRLRRPPGRGAARHRAAGGRPVATVRRADPANAACRPRCRTSSTCSRPTRRTTWCWRSGCSTTCRTWTAVSAEVRRVLRPGGRFVAVTNGDRHTAELRREAGGGPVLTTFSSENGEASLRRHFATVTRQDVETRAVFPDRPSALAYLESSDDDRRVVTARGRLAARVRRPRDGVHGSLSP